jgi:5-(carboxyamino)imidazole ribonucleotide synthase
MPLGDTAPVRPAVMINILGEKGYSGPAISQGFENILHMPGVYVHLYGKTETKPFRKMGHVTVTADSVEDAREIARKVQSVLTVKSK